MKILKNISNWTFGSFFRTLGRFLFYLLGGFLVMLLINSSDIKLPKIFDFMFIRVHASTVSIDQNAYRIRTCGNSNASDCSYVTVGTFGTWYTLPSGHNDKGVVDAYQIRVINDDKFQMGVRYRVRINVQTENAKFNKAPTRGAWCGGMTGATSPTSGWSTSEDLIESCEVSGIMTYDSGNKTAYFVDVVPLTSFNGLQVQFYFQTPIGDFLGKRTRVVDSTKIEVDTSTTDAINNQTTIINEGNQTLTDIDNTLKDTNVTSDTNSAGSWINNLGLNTDGLVSQIVLLPINLISDLINGSCTNNKCETFKGKSICLPNGQLIWGGSSVGYKGLFIIFFNQVVGGYILYKCLCSIARTIMKVLDPTTYDVEVLKL